MVAEPAEDLWNLTAGPFVLVHSFRFDQAFSYADTRPGRQDHDKRALIREAALPGFPSDIGGIAWWAFRIYVAKSGGRRFDIENVPKLIVDSFCTWQIERDGSPHTHLGLYADDTIDHVRVIQVAGERAATMEEEHTLVEIFGRHEP